MREPAFNPGAPLLGRVRLLDELGAVVHQWTSPQPNDLFGLSAILTPDVNADGVADVAIAIPNAFDDVAGTRIGLVVIKSGASGATLTTISGTPLERFGLALFAAPPEPLSLSPTLTVLVEALDPQTSAPSGSFTFQSFDAFSGAFLAEAVQAPEGFTASAAALSLATHIRASGPGDLNASGSVTPLDLSVLANNYGAAVDPVTGELLAQDPSLAAAPTGDTNGDGVVDSADLNTVLSSIGQSFGGGPGGGFEFEGDPLTEAEASAVEAAFGNVAPQGLDCKHCALCHKGYCQVLPNQYSEIDGDDPPEFDDGSDGTEPPDDGGGGPPGSTDSGPNGDDNGDGIPNRDDCLSAHYAGDPMECDTDDDGIPDPEDCGSCLFAGDITQCACADIDITFSPGCSTKTPNFVWIIPTENLPKTVTLTACGGPPGGTYQWTFTPSAVAQLAPGETLTKPTLAVKLLSGGNFSATVQYTVPLNNTPCQKTEQFAGAVVNKVSLESVEFSGGHTVLKDDGTAYPSPAWKDANLDGDVTDQGDHNYPIAFTRNTPWRIKEAIVKLEPATVDVGTVKLTMTSAGKPTIEADSTTVAGGLRFASQPSTAELPNTVDYDAALPIKWSFDFGCEDEPNTRVFSTAQPYYVVLGSPGVRMRHTVVHLACQNAAGASTEAGVINAVWAMFQSSVANGLQRPTDYVWMTYWNPPDGNNQWLTNMLLAPLGNGCCTSWSALFRATLQIHGILDAKVKIVLPADYLQGARILVRNWTFAPQPPPGMPGCGDYKYEQDVDVFNQPGVAGQANPEPPPSFNNHFVVQVYGLIYDPSYGVGPLPVWDFGFYESIALAGYRLQCNLKWMAKPEDLAQVECFYWTSPIQEDP